MSIIPHKISKKIKKSIKIHYSPITDAEKKNLTSLCNALNEESKKLNLTYAQLIMIRDSIIFLLSKRVGTHVFKIGNDIMKMYNKNDNILEIAKHYNIPPISIVYQILIENKHESHKIKRIIKNTALLPTDIQVQMKDIINNDPMYWYKYKVPNVFKYINRLKCPYVFKHRKKEGKKPCILFTCECIYKTKPINWIEFKNIVLFDDDLFLHEINKVVFNFSRFGNGLILFLDIICSKSFMNKISIMVDTYDSFISS